MRFKKRSKLRSFTVIAVPNELNISDGTINRVDLNEELPPGSSIQSPKNTILNRIRSFGRHSSDQGIQRRKQELYGLYDSERSYCQELEELILIIIKLKSLGLSFKLLDIVEQCLRDIALISANLVQALEKIISKRSTSDVGLGDLFNDHFWSEYNRYHFLYCSTIKPYLQEVRKSKKQLNEELIILEDSIGQRLETLFLLPEERIITYRDHLSSIVNCTPVNHRDYANLKRRLDYVEKSLLQNRFREISNVRNELKLEQVELNFHPLDNLQLKNNGGELKMRQIAGRRKSTSALPSLFGNSEQTSSSDDVYGMSRQRSQMKKRENFVRVHIKEGRFLLSSGSQTQERYLFLFTDLLLVAKEKGDNSYRLKDRVRLSEVWICRQKIEEISECVKNPLNAFVVGWPTKNYVAEFYSIEERNLWYNLLETQINIEKERECPKRTTVCINYKTGKKLLSRKIAINNVQTSSEVLNMALNEFDPPLDERRCLQLWVQFGGKESQQYALFGHECVFAILLSYVRDLLPPTDEPDVDFSLVEDLTSSNVNFKCTFFLKAKRTLKKQKTKRHGAGQFVSQFKKRVMIKQDSQDSFNLSSLPHGGGKLFGQPLNTVTENDAPPKAILAIMENVLREGIFMEGIFRKPPNHKVFRELRDKLDIGIAISFDGIQPSVSASLLKEFLRFLPDSVLVSNCFIEWISICDETNVEVKTKKAQNIISQLPPANYQLLRYLMCLLYHVKSKSVINHMNSYNLSICIGPSLINNAASMYTSNNSNDSMNTKRVVEIVQFLIENVIELFGIETLQLLGDVPENPTSKHDSGEESDSFSNLRQETSSLDSLAASGSSPGSSRPQSGLRYPTAMNVSRDSGLSEVHVSADDVATEGNVGGPGSSTPLRSVSQNEELEDYGFIIPSELVKSVENVNVDVKTPKKVSSSVRENRKISPFDALFNQTWSSSRFESSSKNCSKTESSDSLYESLESTCSCDSTPTRPPRQMNTTSATLIRSESGDHLISIVEMNPAPNGLGVDRRHAFRQKVSLALSVPADGNPSSTDNSSPVSPSSSGFGSPRSRRASPSPVSIMSRYSAVRKPARHRKGPAPMPPQIGVGENGSSIVSLSVNDFDDDSQSDVDSGEIYEAQPIIIRCNSDSGDSVPSSIDDDDDVERKTSHKTEIYSLKLSPAPLMHSKSDLLKKISSSDINLPTRKLSLESNEILSSLNDIKDQVSTAHLLQRALLSSRLAPQQEINDSSTVTEASSDESTPHVSRESSRAQEYKQIADEMFKPATTTTISKLVESSPKTNFQRSISSILPNSFKTNESETMTYRAKLVAVNGSESPKQRPFSYTEAIAQRHEPLVESARIASKRNLSVVDYNLTSQDPSARRVSVGPCTSDGALAAAPTAPDHKLTIAVSTSTNRNDDRMYQRRLRRKTLGSDEYATLNDIYSQNMRLDRCYSAKAVPIGNRVDSSTNDARTEEISWSVKQFVNFFDKGAQTQRIPIETSRSKLPWARETVYDRLDLETRPSPKRTASHYVNHNISPAAHNFDEPQRNGCATTKFIPHHHRAATSPHKYVQHGHGHIVTVGSHHRHEEFNSKRHSYETSNGSRRSGEESYV